jgi:hypothetical protein
VKDIIDRLSRAPEKEQRKMLKHLSYVTSVTANIRKRLDCFGECLVDELDLMRIWAEPWIELPGDLKDKVEGMASELDAEAVRLEKDEWKFYRKRHCIVVQ